MMERRYLFPCNTIINAIGKYDVRAHLAQMIAFLGLPPQEFLDREKLERDIKWKEDCFLGKDGKLCFTACEYFGGPLFGDDGNFSDAFLLGKH
jgi:hypothetical protein